MKETARLRLMAAKAKRLSTGVGDPATVASLQAYGLECAMDADIREAEIDNVAWRKLRL